MACIGIFLCVSLLPDKAFSALGILLRKKTALCKLNALRIGITNVTFLIRLQTVAEPIEFKRVFVLCTSIWRLLAIKSVEVGTCLFLVKIDVDLIKILHICLLLFYKFNEFKCRISNFDYILFIEDRCISYTLRKAMNKMAKVIQLLGMLTLG